jgi:hypothetical protein
VFVLMELGRRRILHVNVTDHPSADWTQQQLREALPGDHSFRFLIHDRDSIFSQQLDQSVATMGVRVLRTPPQAPQAKDYVSHCTSSKHCGTNLSGGIRWESFMPCARLGASWPGGS